MSSTPLIALKARSREGEITRTHRPERKSPVVTVDEVDLALDLLTHKYADLAPHADSLREFVFGSRSSAYAIVQMGWAMAKVEKNIGKKQWFSDAWQPDMAKARQEGEALHESTPEGRPWRLGPSERDLLVQAIGPMFVEERLCSERLGDTIYRAVVGGFVKKGTDRTIWTFVGVRVSLKILELLMGEDAIKAFKAQLDEARKQDEEARRAEAAEEAKNGEEGETEPPAGEQQAS